ncbi:MAG: hypothetical protein ACYDEJ_17025 [Desulfitobacteriaceae bacterium]
MSGNGSLAMVFATLLPIIVNHSEKDLISKTLEIALIKQEMHDYEMIMDKEGIMQMDSVDGGKNFLINVCSFLILTILVCALLTPLVKDKIKWFKEIIFGVCVSVILSYVSLIIFLHLWTSNVPYSPE